MPSGTEPVSRFVLRVPKDLHRRLRGEAARRGISLNSLCVSLLDVATRSAATTTDRAPLVDAAATLFGRDLVGLMLFGSVARGEQREGSDTDLLVVLDDTRAISRSLYHVWDEARPAADRVNPHFVHLPPQGSTPTSLWIEVALDGIVLHDPQGTLARRLSGLRRRLASGAVRPGLAHGQRYWVHTAKEVDHA